MFTHLILLPLPLLFTFPKDVTALDVIWHNRHRSYENLQLSNSPLCLLQDSTNTMAFNNMVNVAVDPDLEEKLFLDEVADVKKWWADSRWRYTKRPFTAEQIVAKRGNLKIEYASNTQSKKLWKILEGRFQVYFHNQAGEGNNTNSNCDRTKMQVTPMAAWSRPC